MLQKAGIAAGPVQTLTQVLADPHLLARGFWRTLKRPYVEQFISSTTYFRLRDQPMPIRQVAPTLGQHTHQVLHEVLGLPKEQLTLLDQQGVTGTQARPKA